MRGGAEILDHVSVEDTYIDVVDAEHLWVSDQDGLETLRELRLRVGRLWQWVYMMNLTSGGHDNQFGLNFQLSNLTLNILHHLGE